MLTLHFSPDEHLLKIDLYTDRYSTPPTPNPVHYPTIVEDTLVSSPRHDPRFKYLATHNLNSNTNVIEKNFIG